MKTLYLVRHGTVHNPNRILYRRLPGFLLSDQGHTEAQETREYLAEEPLQVIWHSPLERALQTATIINERHNARMVVEERIHEWAEDESQQEVRDRMQSFLTSWRDSSHAVSAAISHRDPIRRLLFAIRDPDGPSPMEDIAQFPLPQAGVYQVKETADGSLETQLVFVPSVHAFTPPLEVDHDPSAIPSPRPSTAG